MTRALMVQGVSSDAGKSFVVTALCRWFARNGVRVAPFKAQNMSNNARVVDGGEIGSAQWLQAVAAGIDPDVRMNPVLLKPEGDTRSQVIVNGTLNRTLSKQPWRGRSKHYWADIQASYASLSREFDVIVIEGAGSPAELNLWEYDVVNMRVAEFAGAPVLLVADIDRGGAFAHLYGTWALLPPSWRTRIQGFVLNKFRGDPSLLDPAPSTLHALTGVPTVGVLPYVAHALPREEGPTQLMSAHTWPRVAILCGPWASNLDEFVPLQRSAAVELINKDIPLAGYQLVILPGSKHIASDLAWLRGSGLAMRLEDAAKQGTPILGICGGMQALGHAITDPFGVEGAADGLGLLDVTTTLTGTKRTTRSEIQFSDLDAPWKWLSGRRVSVYEIRLGKTAGVAADIATPSDVAFAEGNVVGVYVHGLFEDNQVLRAFTGRDPGTGLDGQFDHLADLVEQHMSIAWLRQCVWS